MRLIKQSQTAQPLMFLMIDVIDHISPKTGLTPTVSLSKNGGVFASPAGAVTEVGLGWYRVAGNATDTNTLGPLILNASGVGADVVDVEYGVVAFDPQSATNLGLSNLDALISSRMATYTQPTGFLAATFPGTVASPTNITAATGIVLSGVTHTGAVIPTVSAVTGLTASNLDATVSSRLASASYVAPTNLTAVQIATGVWQDAVAGDFTVASSIGKALYVGNIVPGASGGLFIAGTNAATTVNITGNITGNLTGSVGSVTGAVGSVTGLTASNLDTTISSRLATASYVAPTNLTAGQIATGVWTDTTAGDFTTALSVGKSVMNGVALGTGLTIVSVSGSVGSVTGNVSGSVASVVGSVGSVTGLTASNLDAAISSRASQASVDTLDDYVDTEVAAIKAKTDQFVFTVANQVDSNALSGGGGLNAAGIRSAIGLASANLDTQLTTLDDYIDTEVAAIKAKTDLIPASPAQDDPNISTRLADVWKRLGLDSGNPLVNTDILIAAGVGVQIAVAKTSTQTTLTRQ